MGMAAMTDWAAKVLEGVPRTNNWSDGEPYMKEADALAAIARMGAGDKLVERLLASASGMRRHYKVGAVELIPVDTMEEAAAHIAALTERNDWLAKIAHTATEKSMKAEAEVAALRAEINQLRTTSDGHFYRALENGNEVVRLREQLAQLQEETLSVPDRGKMVRPVEGQTMCGGYPSG